MPKLTQQSLEKRFTCDYCGKSLRTRQGLSGHTQFAHGDLADLTGAGPQDIDDDYLIEHGAEWRRKQEGVLMPKSQSDSLKRAVVLWMGIRTSLANLGVKTSTDDFKTYILASLATAREKEEIEAIVSKAEERIQQSLSAIVSLVGAAKGI